MLEARLGMLVRKGKAGTVYSDGMAKRRRLLPPHRKCSERGFRGDAEIDSRIALRSSPIEGRLLFRAPSDISQRRFSAIGSSGLFLDAIAEEPLGIDRFETQPMLEFLSLFCDV